MFLTENQLFGSSAGSDLQAINYIIKKYQKMLSRRTIVLDSFFLQKKKIDASYFKVYESPADFFG